MFKRCIILLLVINFMILTYGCIDNIDNRDLSLADDIDVIAFDKNIISVGMLESCEVDTLIVQNPFAIGYMGVENANILIHKKTN